MCKHTSWINGNNDPSAGSPTETLLRLILPLNVMTCTTFWTSNEIQSEELVETLESVGATGGVYKGQGRNQHELVTHAY